jgi:hypothetical protein
VNDKVKEKYFHKNIQLTKKIVKFGATFNNEYLSEGTTKITP